MVGKHIKLIYNLGCQGNVILELETFASWVLSEGSY